MLSDAVECNELTIKNIRSNMRLCGNVHAPLNRGGHRRTTTPLMLDALCHHLFEKPDLYLDELVVNIWDELRMLATTPRIRRALIFKGVVEKHYSLAG